MKRAVITGLGAVTPIGNNVNEFWDNLLKGKSGADIITKFDPSAYKTKFACEVKKFDASSVIEKQEARKMDLFTQYALVAADECIQNSGLNLSDTDLTKVGVILASGIGGMQTFEEEVLNFGQGGKIPRFSPFFITKMIPNIAAGHISIKYGFQGVSFSISSACASSNNAIGTALDLIRLGRANVVLAGGAEASITQASIGGFSAIKALSTKNEDPQTACRPFDKSRDGFVAGEGAGVLMIEELEHALKRGAKIYCELAGYSAASDAYHVVATHPTGAGAVLAMRGAIADAGISAGDVSYINAHATSTPLGDISECKAIVQVFEDYLQKVNISATKSMTGHLLGAAGAIEAIASVKSVEMSQVPPTINLTEIDPDIDPRLNLTPHKAIHRVVNTAINNTFGFGGHTSSTVFKKYE